MPEEAPKVVAAESRRKGAVLLPPADFRGVAPWLLLGGFALGVAGWVDVGMFWYPLHIGSVDWEVGTISQTIDGLPLPFMSLLLIAVGLRGIGTRRIWARLIACAFIAIGLWLLACLVIFLLDVPQVLTAAQRLHGSGLRRAVFKVLLYSLTYAGATITLGVSMWRATSRKSATEVAAKGSK